MVLRKQCYNIFTLTVVDFEWVKKGAHRGISQSFRFGN